MKFKQKSSNKLTLSEKIANALTVKPRADIEDDEVFGTKPHTVSRAEFSSSDSEDEQAISDFRKRNVNLLSEISKKYEGKVVSRKDFKENSDDSSIDSDEGEEAHLKRSPVETSENSNASDTLSNFKKLTALSDSEESEDNYVQKSKKESLQDSDTDDDGENNDSGEESDDYSITQFKKQIQDDDGEDSDEEEEGYDISQMDEPLQEEFQHVKKQNISEETKKGICVRNQLLIWEGLLEMRIHLQKCVNTANQMPMPDTHGELKQHNQFEEECNSTKTNVANLLDKLLSLQNVLLKKFPETKSLSIKQKQSDDKEQKNEASDEEIPSDSENEEIPSDTEDEETVKEDKSSKTKEKDVAVKKRKLEDYETDIATTHKVFKSFRDTTIQKWNDKTRLATAANVKTAPTNTILQQISYILSDKEKLLRRTQLKRSQYNIVGYKKPTDDETVAMDQNGEFNPVIKHRKANDEYISEIFDDSDFYHQLLRELIECKSAEISDPIQLSRQWIALQQMRSKMKRKVDTKATKGRKIKYVVHNQLVNYMAPEKSTTWNEESTKELYSSLFGKMFERNNVGVNDNLSGVLKIKS